jgi:hypothetical protein
LLEVGIKDLVCISIFILEKLLNEICLINKPACSGTQFVAVGIPIVC